MVKNQARAMTYGIGAVLLWSTVATAFKLSLAEMTPAQLLLFASLASTVVLALILGVQGKLSRLKGQFLSNPLVYVQSGLLNPFLYYLVLFAAYDMLPAQQAQPLNYTWAILLSLLAVPMLGQKLRSWDVGAALLAYFGVVVIATGGDLMALEFERPMGVALALLSTLLWSLYWIVNTRDKGDPVISLLLSFLIGLPCILAVCAWRGELSLPSWQGLAGATYVGLFEMGFTFVLWLKAMRTAEQTAPLTNLVFLGPFLSLFFISTFLGETIVPATFMGLALIVCGLLVQQLGPKLIARLAPSRSAG
ncbi:DMT family transporter [Ferrimonas balearica]|uniref:DMT family transporter n=1 Tax=Ferrimonas balearica TaxID=44012 RepID=UPI001C9932D2|nr:DMT family transporter [Ferrimonas balearica]MBY5921853.1 DMT family transporter [Ferrimonas balearica]MBY5994807.1 DMT family transporter [Ferrimonas balearica]